MLTISKWYNLFTSSKVQSNMKHHIYCIAYFHSISNTSNNGNNSLNKSMLPWCMKVVMLLEDGDADFMSRSVCWLLIKISPVVYNKSLCWHPPLCLLFPPSFLGLIPNLLSPVPKPNNQSTLHAWHRSYHCRAVTLCYKSHVTLCFITAAAYERHYSVAL